MWMYVILYIDGIDNILDISLNLPGSNFPVWALVTIFGVVASVIIFFTTRSSKPPRYHFVSIELIDWCSQS